MKVKIHTTEQIIAKLREVERWQSGGQGIAEACKQISVSEHTFYKWRKRYGTMQESEAKRLKELERENGQMKKLVTNQDLDILMLKEMTAGKCLAPATQTAGSQNLAGKVQSISTPRVSRRRTSESRSSRASHTRRTTGNA